MYLVLFLVIIQILRINKIRKYFKLRVLLFFFNSSAYVYYVILGSVHNLTKYIEVTSNNENPIANQSKLRV